MVNDQGVPIFMYHEVVDSKKETDLKGKIQSSYLTPRSEFESHLDCIRANGCTPITLQQLTSWLCGDNSLPARPIVISFDDGYAGNFEHAFPALTRLGYVAEFFVATGKIGDTHMMSWANLREMHKAGMAIESHTATHPLLSTLGRDETREELVKSRAMIQDMLACDVEFVSLPNGDANEWYRALAIEAGYAGGCGSVFGHNYRGVDPYLLRRIAVKRDTTLRQLRGYLSGDWKVMLPGYCVATVKSGLSALVGKRAYDRIYNTLFGVEEQRKSPTA